MPDLNETDRDNAVMPWLGLNTSTPVRTLIFLRCRCTSRFGHMVQDDRPNLISMDFHNAWLGLCHNRLTVSKPTEAAFKCYAFA